MTVPNQCDLAKVKVSRALPPPEAPGENLGLWSPTLPPSPLQCSPELFCLYPSLAWSLGGHIFVGDSFSFQSSKLSFSLLVNIVILFSLPAPLPSLPLLFRPLSFSLLNPPPRPPPPKHTQLLIMVKSLSVLRKSNRLNQKSAGPTCIIEAQDMNRQENPSTLTLRGLWEWRLV